MRERDMTSKFVPAALAALLYAQGLLGFAAVAAALMKDRAPVVQAEAQPMQRAISG